MSNDVYPNTGALFYRRVKKNPSGPDIGGDFTVGEEILKHILAQVKQGNVPVKLELAGWRKTDRKGQAYYSLRVRKPFDEGVQAQAEQGSQQNSNYAAAQNGEKQPWEI